MDEEQMRCFEASYDAYGAMVYRLAMVYLGRRADAEDVTQEVFCRLLWRAPAFLDEAHEKRWLLQVTANLCKDQLKGFWRKRAAALDAELPVERPEDRGVLEAILALPETYKGPIHLHQIPVPWSSNNLGMFCRGNESAKLADFKIRRLLSSWWQKSETWSCWPQGKLPLGPGDQELILPATSELGRGLGLKLDLLSISAHEP